MADYTTYAVLKYGIDIEPIRGSKLVGSHSIHKDNRSYLVFTSADAKFKSLSEVLNLDVDKLKTTQVEMLCGSFWQKFGNSHHDGEDFPLGLINWLGATTSYWTGTEEEYDDYINNDGADLYKSHTYAKTMEEEYPQFNREQDTYLTDVKYVTFEVIKVGNDKAGYWGNWLGKNAKHGDIDAVIFAKDAAKHFNYERFFGTYKNSFEVAESYVTQAELFASTHGDDVSVMFAFG